MVIHNKPISFYTDKLRNNEHFSLGCYGDGEWLGILKERVGFTTTIGTTFTPDLCDALAESLHYKSDNFLFSSSEVLKNAKWTGIGEARIDGYLKAHDLNIEFYEKDEWDRAMKTGELEEFIEQIRKMNVVIVGNKYLRGLNFFNYNHFVEIGYPNCYTDGTFFSACEEAIVYGKPAIYLISCGLSSALLVQKLHGKIPDSWFIDCGSIWDIYCGIGAQRGWRGELYSDKEKLKEFLRKTLNKFISEVEVEKQYELILRNLDEMYPNKYA